MKVKSFTPEMSKKEVVYEIPCQDCDSVYIGETGRSLERRITEHKYAVKTGDGKNGVAVHAWDEEHRMDWEGAKSLEYKPNYWKRRVLEAIWIKKTSINSNLDCGLTLNQTWLAYID